VSADGKGTQSSSTQSLPLHEACEGLGEEGRVQVVMAEGCAAVAMKTGTQFFTGAED
jgi:hypothetical protein